MSCILMFYNNLLLLCRYTVRRLICFLRFCNIYANQVKPSLTTIATNSSNLVLLIIMIFVIVWIFHPTCTKYFVGIVVLVTFRILFYLCFFFFLFFLFLFFHRHCAKLLVKQIADPVYIL